MTLSHIVVISCSVTLLFFLLAIVIIVFNFHRGSLPTSIIIWIEYCGNCLKTF